MRPEGRLRALSRSGRRDRPRLVEPASGPAEPARADTAIDVLTWNLFHGRALPAGGGSPPNRKFIVEMADVIARRSPAIAALQEVPPRAIPALAARTGMRALTVLTSPLVGPPGLRGWLGERNPNLWRTHEGNSNVLLVRRDWRIVPGSAFGFRLNASRAMRADVRAFAVPPAERMRWRLEQRRMVGATLESSDGRRVTVGSLHAHNARDPCVVAAELRRAVAFLLLAAGDLPIVLAGDLNARVGEQGYVETVAAGFVQPAPCDAAIDPTRVDHILERGLEVVCAPRPIPAAERTLSIVVAGRTMRVELSDHPAYAARLAWRTPPQLSRG